MLKTPAGTVQTYEDALRWLFAQTRGGAPRDAGRMRRLMAQLELKSPPNAVHVVGTNGKGSVTAMLAAGLQGAGVRTGRFISPHVVDFRERVAVDGRWIPEAEVLGFVQQRPALEPPPAFFELALALALEHFARERVGMAVVEAGVGARNDATRVLENVRAVVITNVGRDHLDTLGPALADVARDKADAVRPGVPTLTAASGEALELITEVAAERDSRLYTLSADEPLFGLPAGLESPPTRALNQRLAAATLRLLGVPETAVRRGLSATLPARTERFLVGNREVVLDGAHNPDAARALLGLLRPPFTLLFGALPKKLGAETLDVLLPYAAHAVLTDAAPGQANALRGPGLTFIPEPEAALERALALTPPGRQLVVAGSFYLAGRLRGVLERSR